jgi:recombination protein RecT
MTKVTTPEDMRNGGNSRENQDPSQTLRQLLVRQKNQIEMALPRHLNPDRLLRVALTAISKTPKLAECTQVSVLGSIIQAAQLGLEPDGALGHAYLVPFWNDRKKQYECQMIPGYRGMLDLAGRSGRVVTVSARVVYEYDSFDFSYGLDDFLHHKPTADDSGNPTHVYAVAKLINGGHLFEVMTIGKVESVRNQSSGYQAYKAGRISDTPWVSHFDDMARKTLVRVLFKWLPVSIEIQKAVGLDELAEAGVSQDLDSLIIDVKKEPIQLQESQKRKASQEPAQSQDKTAAVVDNPVPDQQKQEEESPDGSSEETESNDSPPMTEDEKAEALAAEREEAARYEEEERAAIQGESQKQKQMSLRGEEQSHRRRSRLQQ